MKSHQALLLVSTLLACEWIHAASTSKVYRNAEYGFAVHLPEQATIEQAAPPAPAHGAVARLPSGAEIRVDGEYDAAFLGSASAAARRIMEDESFTSSPPLETVRTAGPGARCFGRVSEHKVQRRCIVYRHRPNASAIIYTLALDGSASSPRNDEAVFNRLIRSFRFEPLPD